MSYIAREYAQNLKAGDVIIHERRVCTVVEVGETPDHWVSLKLSFAGIKCEITSETFPLASIEKLFIEE